MIREHKSPPPWYLRNVIVRKEDFSSRDTKSKWFQYLGGLSEPCFHGVTWNSSERPPVAMGNRTLERAVFFEAPGQCWEIVPEPYMAAWNDLSPAAGLTGQMMLEYAFYKQVEFPDVSRPVLTKGPGNYSRYGQLFSERILSRVPSGEWDLSLDTVIRWLHAVEEVAPSDPGAVQSRAG